MLDIRFIKENLEAVRQNIRDRYMDADVDLLVSLYDKKNATLRELEESRRLRNENAQAMKSNLSKEERAIRIEEGKRLKEIIAHLEAELQEIERAFAEELAKIPNMAHPKAPRGKEDKDNLEVKRVGSPTQFNFPPKDHVELGQSLDILDFDTATKVSGTKFYYLKNEGTILELALVRYALDMLSKHGFTLMTTPDIAKSQILEGIGFIPRGPESNVYTLEGEEACLIGTAEITLGGYHSDSVLEKKANFLSAMRAFLIALGVKLVPPVSFQKASTECISSQR